MLMSPAIAPRLTEVSQLKRVAYALSSREGTAIAPLSDKALVCQRQATRGLYDINRLSFVCQPWVGDLDFCRFYRVFLGCKAMHTCKTCAATPRRW